MRHTPFSSRLLIGTSSMPQPTDRHLHYCTWCARYSSTGTRPGKVGGFHPVPDPAPASTPFPPRRFPAGPRCTNPPPTPGVLWSSDDGTPPRPPSLPLPLPLPQPSPGSTSHTVIVPPVSPVTMKSAVVSFETDGGTRACARQSTGLSPVAIHLPAGWHRCSRCPPPAAEGAVAACESPKTVRPPPESPVTNRVWGT